MSRSSVRSIVSLATTLCAALALPACADGGADGTPNAVFSTADDAHLYRTVFAASGRDGFEVTWLAAIYGGDERQGCPTVHTVGDTTTVTGGCRDDHGTLQEGTVVMTNVLALFDPGAGDPKRPSTIEAHQFREAPVDGLGDAIDGLVSWTWTTRAQTQAATVDVTLLGIHARNDATYVCDGAAHMCDVAPGAQVSVDGVGVVKVSGSFWMHDSYRGQFVLEGAERLVVDVGQSNDDCFHIAIEDGPGRIVCRP